MALAVFFTVSVVMTFAMRRGQSEGDTLQLLPFAVGIHKKDL